jgi:hypothetical protein
MNPFGDRIIVDAGIKYAGRTNACFAASFHYAEELKQNGAFVPEEKLRDMIDNLRGMTGMSASKKSRSKEFVSPIIEDPDNMDPVLHPEVQTILKDYGYHLQIFIQNNDETDVTHYCGFDSDGNRHDALDSNKDICIVLVMDENHWCTYALQEEEDLMEKYRQGMKTRKEERDKKNAAQQVLAVKKKATKRRRK